MLRDDPMRLLSLLHCRSAYELEEWATFDMAQLKLGFSTGQLAYRYNETCVVLHGKDYGQLVAYDKDEAHRHGIIGWPRAISMLESQNTQLSFLHDLTQLLTAALPAPRGDAEWQKMVVSGFKASGQTEIWSSFANQVFLAPPIFDLARSLRTAEALLAAAEDDLELMQTEPEYLQDLANRRSRAEQFADWMTKEV